MSRAGDFGATQQGSYERTTDDFADDVRRTREVAGTPSGMRGADYYDDDDDTDGGEYAGANVGRREREISLVAGAALGIFGLTRPMSVPGLVSAGVGAALLYCGLTGQSPLYGALGVSTKRRDQLEPGREPREYFDKSIHVEHGVTILKSPEELYGFWRNFENLPRFMKHLQSVKVIDEKRSRWVAKAPLGTNVEWDAEIINDEPNTTIAWRSLAGADVDNSGSVRFVRAPGNKGTEVHVVIDYIPPAGRIGAWVAKLFGEEPKSQLRDDLRRFKQIIETGEIPTIQSQPRGACGGGKRGSRSAGIGEG